LPGLGFHNQFAVGTLSGDPDLGQVISCSIALIGQATGEDTVSDGPVSEAQRPLKKRPVGMLVAVGTCLLLAGAGWLVHERWRANVPAAPVQRSLTRLTFDDGLQTGATWSPDGRFIAYSSDRGGKYDIWIQQISGGDPVQVTRDPGQHWQPDWSPDGKYIAYRSEEGDGGLYITPALGGAGLQRRIASFGYFPRWSPEGSQILFQTSTLASYSNTYVVALDGSPPREVLTGTKARYNDVYFSVWHPDGKRITSWIFDRSSSPPAFAFLTEPVEGGPAIETRFPRGSLKEMEDETAIADRVGLTKDSRFCWAPSGKAIYLERTFRGARNIWRMTVDPVTLQATTVERLTTSPGPDVEPSISPDGKKLAFTNERQQVRAWAFPFDASHGRVTGPGQPVTSAAGINAYAMNLSRDGKRLSIWGLRGGQYGIWETSVINGREEPMVVNDAYVRDPPIWSPDGERAAYLRMDPSTGKAQIVVWSSGDRSEEPLEVKEAAAVFDWSPDGKLLLFSKCGNGRCEIWQAPVSDAASSETAARKIASDPNYYLFQPHISRDGGWIAFEAVGALSQRWDSTLYVIPAAGGPWIRVTNGKQYDDKPRWSPDGKILYFLSDRAGFFNLWGIRFDPAKGKPLGEPFRVTSFDSPTMMISRRISKVEISLTEDRLVMPIAQASGNIWVLDNVDR
jgi:Tol biopolymer transport system component